MKKLIVNADDLGLTKGINKGIIKGYCQGIITSATALVNMPAWEHAAGLLDNYPRLGVGLHFNLTCGSPVTAPEHVPSLVNEEGRFRNDLEALALADPVEVARELYNQFDRLVRSGIKPTHVDSHHDIHTLDNVMPVVLLFASSLGLPVRLVPWAQVRYSSAGTRTTDDLVVKFRDRGANRMNFERLLSECTADTVEIRCHPGMVDFELEQCSGYTWQRERELAVVCAYNKDDFPQAFGYKLITFSGLKDFA
jgi:predicted glycoside hydrolase/deacetylase ChbG (UPF0249 family)